MLGWGYPHSQCPTDRGVRAPGDRRRAGWPPVRDLRLRQGEPDRARAGLRRVQRHRQPVQGQPLPR